MIHSFFSTFLFEPSSNYREYFTVHSWKIGDCTTCIFWGVILQLCKLNTHNACNWYICLFLLHLLPFHLFIIQQNRKEIRKETISIHANNKPNLKNDTVFFMWIYEFTSTSEGVNYYTSSAKTMTQRCNQREKNWSPNMFP